MGQLSNLSVQFCTLSVQKLVQFNATDKCYIVLMIRYLKIRNNYPVFVGQLGTFIGTCKI